jgi:hypothetical protein
MSDEKTLELIGDDSQIFTGALASTELVGDGTKTLDALGGGTLGDKSGAGMYIVTAKGTTSFFPSLLKVGELYPAAGSEVLTVGDKVKKLTLTQVADATGWKFSISRSKIETTRLAHRFKKYRLGKYDASGTLSSIFTVGITDANGGLITKTMKMFKKAANGTITITEVDDSPLYFLGYVRKTSVSGETEDFVFGQIYLHDMTLGGQSGSAQSYDANMSLTGIDPVFYSIDII